MLDNYGIRTDLALETTERFTEKKVESGWKSTKIIMKRKISVPLW